MTQKTGFTLIELLVVVLIIGILAAIAVPQYQKAVLKSRSSEMLIAGKAFWTAEQAYYLATGSYTTNPNDLDISMSDGTISGSSVIMQNFDVALRNGAPQNIVAVRSAGGTKPQPIQYEIIFAPNGVYCRVMTSDTTAQNFCTKTLGAANNPQVIVSGWYDYKLNY